jgi:hypothetical protein
MSSDMDLPTAYQNLGTGIYTFLQMLWVKGHQDKYTARMNIRADELAEQHCDQNQAAHHRHRLSQANYLPAPGQALQLIINGFVVTQSQTRWIRHQISGYNMIIYLQEKNDWD